MENNRTDKSTVDFYVHLILGCLFVIPLASEIISCSFLTIGSYQFYITCFAFVIFSYFIFFNKYTMIVSGSIVLVIVLIGTMLFLGNESAHAYILSVYEYLENAYLFSVGVIHGEYNGFIFNVICASLCFFFSALYRYRLSFFLFLIVGGAVFGANMALGYHHRDDLFIVFVFFLLVTFFFRTNASGRLKLIFDNAYLVATVLLLCFTIMLLAVYIPKPSFQIQLSGIIDYVGEAWNRTGNLIYLSFDSGESSSKRSGYISGGRLGGNISLDNDKVLKVKTDKYIYIAGSKKNIYTGDSWLSSFEGTADEYQPLLQNPDPGSVFSDYLENYTPSIGENGESALTFPYGDISDFELFFNVLYSYNTDTDISNYQVVYAIDENGQTIRTPFFNDLTRGISINEKVPFIAFLTDRYPAQSLFESEFPKIKISNLQSKFDTIFSPDKTVYFEPSSANLLVSKDKMFKLQEYPPSNFEYELTYNDININCFLQVQERLIGGGYYERLLNAIKNNIEQLTDEERFDSYYNVRLFYKSVLEQLVDLSSFIYENYTGLPDTIPQRVYDLTYDVTKDYDNDYDKLKAIELFLRRYEYTLSPGDVPEGFDFVDYFLFENQRGYCTYYASAFSVMARIIGVPSRICEGYAVERTWYGQSFTEVLNKNAHAWPEVYLEGAGWITFEPTTSYSSVYYGFDNPEQPLVTRKPEETAANSAKTEDISETNKPERMEEALLSQTRRGDQDPEDLEEEFYTMINQSKKMVNTNLVLFIVLSAIVFSIAMKNFTIYIINAIMFKHNREKAYKKMFKELLYYNRKLGYGMRNNETVFQYNERLKLRRDFLNYFFDLNPLTEKYNAVLYGGENVSHSDLVMLKKSNLYLKDIIRRSYPLMYLKIVVFGTGAIY